MTLGNYRTIALIVASAMFMEQLDATVLATALPTMARDFGVTPPHMSVALTSYLLSLAIFIPASGWMADRYGARTVFRSAILVFTIGSVLCAQASSLPWLVAARLLQGLGGAMMMPVGRLVILRSVKREDMVSAMTWLLVPALLGPIVGPPLGGVIVTYLNWHWIFYINLPIGLLGMILVSRYITNWKGEGDMPLDVLGLVLSGLSLGCLFFGFELISREGQVSLALALLAVGLVAGAFYLLHARRHARPARPRAVRAAAVQHRLLLATVVVRPHHDHPRRHLPSLRRRHRRRPRRLRRLHRRRHLRPHRRPAPRPRLLLWPPLHPRRHLPPHRLPRPPHLRRQAPTPPLWHYARKRERMKITHCPSG